MGSLESEEHANAVQSGVTWMVWVTSSVERDYRDRLFNILAQVSGAELVPRGTFRAVLRLKQAFLSRVVN